VGKWVGNESANSRVLEEVAMLRYCGEHAGGLRGRSDPKRASSEYEVASIKVRNLFSFTNWFIIHAIQILES
jgi:hypothetical protein